MMLIPVLTFYISCKFLHASVLQISIMTIYKYLCLYFMIQEHVEMTFSHKLYRRIVGLQDCRIAVLQYCSIAVLQYCSIAVLPYCSIAVLQYCSIAVLQYCSIAVLQ